MTLFARTRKQTLTAAALLARLLTVDGDGSGLDADLVRGTTPTAAGLSALSLTSIAEGGLIIGSAANAVTTLPIGTTGKVLRSNGTTAAWAALDAGDITAGTLAVARGGTGLASYTTGDLPYASGTTTLSKLGIGTSGYVLRSNGSAPAWAALDAGDVSAGTLAAARGGTGVSNAGTITNASNTTITGGGTLALGGFTLTVPATGTTALLGTANTFTAANIFQSTLTLNTLTSGTVLSANADTDTSHILGRARLGFAASGSSDYAYFAHYDTFTGTNYAIAQGAAGDTYFNCASGQTLNFNVANGNRLSINGTTNTFNATNTTNFANTTDATSSSAAGVTLASGLAVAKGQYIGTFLRVGTTATLTQTTGTTLTILSTQDSTSANTGCLIASGGITSKKTVYMSGGCIIESQSSAGLLLGTAGVSTKGSTIASSAGTSGNYNGMFFNSNAAGAGDTGSQYNTSYPTWRMALGGGSAEWNGADNWSVARVAAGGTVTSPTTLLKLTSAGSLILNSAAVATNATDGFLYVAACAGTPTGAPTAATGRVPIVVDSTNHKLYFYSGGAWRDAGP